MSVQFETVIGIFNQFLFRKKMHWNDLCKDQKIHKVELLEGTKILFLKGGPMLGHFEKEKICSK